MPDSEQIPVPSEAVNAAKLTGPSCDRCGVAYVEEYRGPCQEPLPPYDDPDRTCPGTVGLRLEDQIAAAAPALRKQGAEEADASLRRVIRDLVDAGLESGVQFVPELWKRAIQAGGNLGVPTARDIEWGEKRAEELGFASLDQEVSDA